MGQFDLLRSVQYFELVDLFLSLSPVLLIFELVASGLQPLVLLFIALMLIYPIKAGR